MYVISSEIVTLLAVSRLWPRAAPLALAILLLTHHTHPSHRFPHPTSTPTHIRTKSGVRRTVTFPCRHRRPPPLRVVEFSPML